LTEEEIRLKAIELQKELREKHLQKEKERVEE
jgi:hypothetical protein